MAGNSSPPMVTLTSDSTAVPWELVQDSVASLALQYCWVVVMAALRGHKKFCLVSSSWAHTIVYTNTNKWKYRLTLKSKFINEFRVKSGLCVHVKFAYLVPWWVVSEEQISEVVQCCHDPGGHCGVMYSTRFQWLLTCQIGPWRPLMKKR